MAENTPAPVIALLAGEPSGDALGAGLMRALNARRPEIRFVGVGGPAMCAAGLESLVPLEALSVHGFVDPVRRLPALWRIFRTVRHVVHASGARAFVGIDFNVFNLLLERTLKRGGVRTAHYVSPSVYAWRRGRIRRIARAADLLLALFPFEPPLYAGTGVRAVFVGHPLADELRGDADRSGARAELGLDGEPLLALLPGSRLSEVKLMGRLFVDTAAQVRARRPGLRCVVPCVNAAVRAEMARVVEAAGAQGWVTLRDGEARTAMRAADAVLVKSGTGTLEALLLERPMVVAYRLGRVTAAIVRRLLRTPFVALPNILAGRAVVPELLQDDATPGKLAAALERVLDEGDEGMQALRTMAGALRQGANARAAEAVLHLAGLA